MHHYQIQFGRARYRSLAPLANRCLASVSISLTTLDHQLARRLEPRATAPRRRLEVIRRLAGAGIPVNVSVAPIVPVLTDSELETVVAAAADAGAVSASYLLLRLPREVNGLFQQWLAAHYPHKAAHVMSIIRQSRGGKENDPRFGTRKRGTGVFADLIANRFALAVSRNGLDRSLPPLTTELFSKPVCVDSQLALI
jgi:DNA repair photolyase